MEQKIYGQISEEALALIQQYQRHSQELVYKLGHLDMQKQQLREAITQTNAKAETVLRKETERLGIPEEAQWNVNAAGQIVSVE